jgi:predicted AlkP superfamily phosphohydrolase/phosphomutase
VKDGSNSMSIRKAAIPFIILSFCISVLAVFHSCAKKSETGGKKVLILGIDGMDPKLLQRYMDLGEMPNFKGLIGRDNFLPLKTSIPPQSPVAWANFITSQDPGGHGIFDFIHREPDNFNLYLSTSRTEDPPEDSKIQIGNWVIPLESGDVELLRRGRPFWEYLEDAGVPCTIFRVPSNFPPEEGQARTFSGMGTPDILGSYGTFSFYTDNPPDNMEDVTGGEIYPTFPHDNVAECVLHGPKNTFRLAEDEPYIGRGSNKRRNYAKLEIPFTVYIDPENDAAKIEIGDDEILLAVGQWSDWVKVEFELIPHLKYLSGLALFYLQEVRPDFKLYVSPIQIDPSDPALPLSTPPEYAEELYDAVGYFYTQGMAEDTKACSHGVFTDEEFLEQAEIVKSETFDLFKYHLENFDDGVLFFYFSTLDLGQHMFYRYINPKSPMHEPFMVAKMGDVVMQLYHEMDTALGMALPYVDDDTTLIVMSDHGFAPFDMGFNLNSWLLDNGYLYLTNPAKRDEAEYFEYVDWGRTRAYGLGINGLYINQRGREWSGIISPGPEKESLMNELKNRLEALVDPETGEHPILTLYRADQVYHGTCVDIAPDLIVGYNNFYRASWETTLGEFPLEWFVPNDDKWAGDHCVDTKLVPGSIVTNRAIKKTDPSLLDIGPTVLKIFGVEIPENMQGKPIF